MRWWGWIGVVLGGLWLVGVGGESGLVLPVALVVGIGWAVNAQRRIATLESRVQALEARQGLAPVPGDALPPATANDAAAGAAANGAALVAPPLGVPVEAAPALRVGAAEGAPAVDAEAWQPAPLPLDFAAPPATSPTTPPTTPLATPPVPRPSQAAAPAAVATAPDESALPVTTSIGASLRAWLRGGNTIVRVAVLILFVGVAFLVRYAAERTTVPIEWRLAGVALAGVALTLLGVRLARARGERAARRGYGLSLQGAGTGVVFLVLFAAYRLYGLLPAEAAFALLVAMAAVTALLAVWQDALALALLGFTGAFLAPVLASRGDGSHVALFSYFLVLNLAIAWISTRQSWKLLNLAGFAFTFGIAGLWGASAWEPRHFATTEPFLVAHFLLYLAIGIGYTRRLIRVTEAPADASTIGATTPTTTGDGNSPRSSAIPLVDAGLLFGVPMAAFALQAAMLHRQPLALAATAAVMSAIYLGVGRMLWAQGGRRMQLLVEALLALGVVFLGLVTPLALDARGTGIAWAVQGAGIVWIGLRQRRWWAVAIGLLLQAGAATSLWSVSRDAAGVLAPLVLGLSAGVSAWLLQRAARALDAQANVDGAVPALAGQPIARLMSVLHHAALAAAVVQTWIGACDAVRGPDSVGALLPFDEPLRLTLLTLGFVLALPPGARRLDWPQLEVPARVLLAAALAVSAATVAIAVVEALGARTVDYGRDRVIEIAALAAVGLWLATRLDRPAPSRLRRFELLLLAWVAMLHGGVMLQVLASQAIARRGAWPDAAVVVLPTLMAFFWLRRQRAGRFPLAAPADAPRPAPLATFGRGLHAPWTIALGLWSLAVNLVSDGAMQPLPYLPLVNPIDLAQLLAALYGVAWLRTVPAGTGRAALRAALAAALIFVWLNGILVRSLHHWAGTPGWTAGALGDATVQTGLTVLWTLIALVTMLAATRRLPAVAARPAWMVGAALLAVVVAKLFLVDLSSVGTLARIVSFLGVGGLMLVIGYVSPLPPAASAPTAARGELA